MRVLIDGGANLEAHDCHFGTPLHVACAREHLDCAKVLLNAGVFIRASVHVGVFVCVCVISVFVPMCLCVWVGVLFPVCDESCVQVYVLVPICVCVYWCLCADMCWCLCTCWYLCVGVGVCVLVCVLVLVCGLYVPSMVPALPRCSHAG